MNSLQTTQNQQLTLQFLRTSSSIATAEQLAAVRMNPQIPRYGQLQKAERVNWLKDQIMVLNLLRHTKDVEELDVLIDAGATDDFIMESADYRALTQVEMQDAFKHGINGDYGEFFGITPVSLTCFLRGYQKAEKWQKAKAIIYAREKEQEEAERQKESRVLMAELKKRGIVGNSWGKKEKPAAEDSEEHRKKIARQREEIMRQYSGNPNIDRMFIGAVRSNTGIIRFMIGEGENTRSYSIPYPDKQLGFELSNAIQSYMIRRDKQLKNQ